MFERFTGEARQIVIGAQAEARQLGHPVIGTEHVLLSMLTSEGTVADLLRADGIDAAAVRTEITQRVDPHPGGPTAADRDAEDAAALRAIGIDLEAVRAAIEENFGAGSLHLPRPAPKKRGLLGRFYAAGGHTPFSARAKKVLELSLREAVRLKQKFIAPEHIMLGLLREGNGLAALILADHQVDLDRLRTGLTTALDTRPR
jgi:ATP-dependent Clp protease ATP-binding subunit ClpA